jgi:hypothetical protein
VLTVLPLLKELVKNYFLDYLRVVTLSKYELGDLVIVRGRALSMSDNAFFIGIIMSKEKNNSYTHYHDDLWNTKQFIWEKIYKVLVQGTIRDIHYYHIKGKLE